MKLKPVIVVLLFTPLSILSVSSIVYNLRIAETTKRPVVASRHDHYLFSALLFDQFKVLSPDIHINSGGGLASFAYVFHPFSIRVDAAVGHVIAEFNENLRTSITQTDDILLTLSFSPYHRENLQVTVSTLIGIPTHGDCSLAREQFGIAHFAAGEQIDCEWTFAASEDHAYQHALVSAFRFIHFFPRNTRVLNQVFDFGIGNAADLFIAYYYTFNKARWEIGYNPGFLFNACLDPNIDNAQSLIHYKRSGFYTSYSRLLKSTHHKNGIGCGVSYAFDHVKNLGYLKHGSTLWAYWGIEF